MQKNTTCSGSAWTSCSCLPARLGTLPAGLRALRDSVQRTCCVAWLYGAGHSSSKRQAVAPLHEETSQPSHTFFSSPLLLRSCTHACSSPRSPCRVSAWDSTRQTPPLRSEYVAVLQRFVETRSSYARPMVFHAVAAAMRTLLSDWTLLVTQLEHQLRLGQLNLQVWRVHIP